MTSKKPEQSPSHLQSKSSEYDALRNELLQWQSRRITLVGTSAVVITAVLGLDPTAHESDWGITSAVLLLFLACICYLTAYCGASGRTLGTYLQVHHGQSDWERRLGEFKVNSFVRSIVNLNTGLAFIYAVMGFVAVAIPSNLFKHPLPDSGIFVFLSLGLFVISWGWLTLSSTLLSGWLRNRDYEKWTHIE